MLLSSMQRSGQTFIETHKSILLESGFCEKKLIHRVNELRAFLYEEKEVVQDVRQNHFYNILNENFSDVCTDDNGAYIHSRSTKN